MSSIISDLFYGSKRNILDNYLVNRQDYQQPTLQKHSTVILSSFIEFILRIPANKELKTHQCLKVTIEMGKKQQQGFIDIQEGGGSINLKFGQLQKDQLNKYTNIKIIISQGKNQRKMIGFIPIQTIKSMYQSNSNQKNIIVQLKGKRNLGFSTIQCTIVLQMQNNNILNSQLLNSADKQQSSFPKIKNRNISDLSSNQHFIRNINDHLNKKTNIIKKVSVNKRQGEQKRRKKVSEDEINITEHQSYLMKSDINNNNTPKSIKHPNKIKQNQNSIVQIQKMKEVQRVNIKITQLIMKNKQIYHHQFSFKNRQKSYALQEDIQFKNISRNGIDLQVMHNMVTIGVIHFNVLFLTSQVKIAELPIYSGQSIFIGTAIVHNTAKIVQSDHTYQQSTLLNLKNQILSRQQQQRKHLIYLSIQKIIFITNFDQQTSISQSDELLYNFSKIQYNNKLRVVIRLNNNSWEFDNLIVRFAFDRQEMKIINLMRKEGFNIEYDSDYKQEVKVQIEIFSQLKLLSYSQYLITNQNTFNHQFLIGHTNQTYAHAALYLKTMVINSSSQHFSSINLKSIFLILRHILDNRILLSQYSNKEIKQIINSYKHLTFIQIKKLFVILQEYKYQMAAFQESKVYNIYEMHEQNNDDAFRIMVKLMQQFMYVDGTNSKQIEQDQFDNIVEFYAQDYKQYIVGEDEERQNCWIKYQDKILFPFLIAGFYFQEKKITITQNNVNQNDLKRNENSLKQQEIKRQMKQVKMAVNDKIMVKQEIKKIKIECNCHIQKILIFNANFLNLSLGKIPNVTLNISKKVFYSNNDPQFVIGKQINILEPVKIYHKKVGSEDLYLLCQFMLQKRKTSYQLEESGKSRAKVVWGY